MAVAKSTSSKYDPFLPIAYARQFCILLPAVPNCLIESFQHCRSSENRSVKFICPTGYTICEAEIPCILFGFDDEACPFIDCHLVIDVAAAGCMIFRENVRPRPLEHFCKKAVK